VDRHVAPLGHIILIPSKPVFDLSPYCCVCSGEATIARQSLQSDINGNGTQKRQGYGYEKGKA
jgi:hypothetical protein